MDDFSLYGLARREGELVALFNPLSGSKDTPVIQTAANLCTLIAQPWLDPNSRSRLDAVLYLMQTADRSALPSLTEAQADYKQRRTVSVPAQPAAI